MSCPCMIFILIIKIEIKINDTEALMTLFEYEKFGINIIQFSISTFLRTCVNIEFVEC